MQLDGDVDFSSLEEYAQSYVQNRVEALIWQNQWHASEDSEIGQTLYDMSRIENRLSELDAESLLFRWKSDSEYYMRELAKQAYMQGILDGGKIANAFFHNKLPDRNDPK